MNVITKITLKNLFQLDLFVGAILLFPSLVHADIVWPAMYLESRLLTWWVVLLGLAIEFLVLWKGFSLSLRKALAVDLVANAISSLCGIALIPIAGIVWEIFPGLVLFKGLGIGTFNPFTWAATFLMAVFINAAIEWLVVKRIFKLHVGKRGFWVLVGANALSVGVAFVSFGLRPID